MSTPLDISIAAKNYKCFGQDPQGLDNIYPVNIIIGRNNSGKSALIDLINYIAMPYVISEFGHKNTIPQIYITKTLTKEEISKYFPTGSSGGGIPARDFFEYGKAWIGKKITVELISNKKKKFIKIEPKTDIPTAQEIFKSLGQSMDYPLMNMTFKRLLSDRDIIPENDENPSLSPNGIGATNIIQNFINKEYLDRSLVEDKLLSDLNAIFQPDSSFNRILVQQKKNNQWEIFLEEENKGIISLSNSGSGLKTIMLVLINFILVPVMENKQLDSYIFAFEELENNLHPALQRKLLTYIHDVAIDKKCCIFLSTHSGVIIDLFSKNESVQIIHVTHNGEFAQAKRVQTYTGNKGILDDLDIRASDLLQSNCIIWVEGPSDRLYFNRWIELWSNSELREGAQYQCIFYGGRLLSHYDAVEPENAEGISILNVNRNAIILIDSDKDDLDTELNDTKKRVISEIEKNEGLAWMTIGREIENYIPIEALKQYYNNDIADLELFTKFSDYLNNIKQGEGDSFLRSKVLFTERFTPLITKEMLEHTHDLKEKLTETCSRIRKWNNL